jgi:hypothetical protein
MSSDAAPQGTDSGWTGDGYIPGEVYEPARAPIPEQLLRDELKAIGVAAARGTPTVENNLCGLALSGGGIRSATFCLGILQALAAQAKLERFHYLSTVSGGGYTGCSLTWFLSQAAARAFDRRRGSGPPGDPAAADRESRLLGSMPFNDTAQGFPYGTADPYRTPTGADPDVRAWLLGFLRRHGNYLTPGGGITLGSGIGVVLRNILLNLIVWIPIAAAAMLLLRGVEDYGLAPAHEVFPWLLPAIVRAAPGLFGWFLVAATASGCLFVMYSVLFSLATYMRRRKAGFGSGVSRYMVRRNFERRVRWLLLVIAVGIAVGTLPLVDLALGNWWDGAVRDAGGVAGTLGGIVAGLWSYARSKRDGGTSSAVIAVVGAILMIYGVGLVGYRFADMYLTEISGVRLALVCFGLPLAVALASGWFVNINYISLHRFYRDRLMEAFLPDIAGALHQRTGPARAAD